MKSYRTVHRISRKAGEARREDRNVEEGPEPEPRPLSGDRLVRLLLTAPWDGACDPTATPAGHSPGPAALLVPGMTSSLLS